MGSRAKVGAPWRYESLQLYVTAGQSLAPPVAPAERLRAGGSSAVEHAAEATARQAWPGGPQPGYGASRCLLLQLSVKGVLSTDR